MSRLTYYARKRLTLHSQEVDIKVDDPIHATVNDVPIGTIADITASNVTLTVVGNSPNNNGASLGGANGQALTLQPADGTHPGVVTAGNQTFGGDKTFLGNIFAANLTTGNLAMAPFGAAPNANAGTISAGTLTLQPADSTRPGGISLSAQTLGSGTKTINGDLYANNIQLQGTLPFIGVSGGFKMYREGGTSSATNTRYFGGSGNDTSSGASCTGLGVGAMENHTTGITDTCLGSLAGASLTTADRCTFVGYNTGGNVTTGSRHTGLGRDALSSVTTGTDSIGLGYAAGSTHTGADSFNIDIGNPGVNGESRVIRIGNSTDHTGNCYIQAISGKTVAGGVPVLVDAAGLLGDTPSSERYKENIKLLPNGVSERIYDLSIKQFNYNELGGNGADRDEIQYGPIAEEAIKIFPELITFEIDEKFPEKTPRAIRSHLFVPLLVDQVQKLNKRVLALEERRDRAKKQKK